MTPSPDPSTDVPVPLARALRAAGGVASGPSARVDEAVRAAARVRLAPARPRSIPMRFSWAALAAAAALVMYLALRAGDLPGRDLDGSGDVDVRDAFLLARALRDGARLEPRWDLNSDGRVDEADVDVLMVEATQL